MDEKRFTRDISAADCYVVMGVRARTYAAMGIICGDDSERCACDKCSEIIWILTSSRLASEKTPSREFLCAQCAEKKFGSAVVTKAFLDRLKQALLN